MTLVFFSLMQPYVPVHEAENESPVNAKARVCVAMTFTRHHAGMLFVWRWAQTYMLHSHKQTHACCVWQARHSHAPGRKFTKTHTHARTCTHIPCNKGPTVCGGKMNRLYCIIRMTHQTVINENRMKVLIKGEKCRHEEGLKTKRWGFWQESGAVLSPRLRRT